MALRPQVSIAYVGFLTLHNAQLAKRLRGTSLWEAEHIAMLAAVVNFLPHPNPSRTCWESVRNSQMMRGFLIEDIDEESFFCNRCRAHSRCLLIFATKKAEAVARGFTIFWILPAPNSAALLTLGRIFGFFPIPPAFFYENFNLLNIS
jgi:hypothetical protein